jgi:hypothetical protein
MDPIQDGVFSPAHHPLISDCGASQTGFPVAAPTETLLSADVGQHPQCSALGALVCRVGKSGNGSVTPASMSDGVNPKCPLSNFGISSGSSCSNYLFLGSNGLDFSPTPQSQPEYCPPQVSRSIDIPASIQMQAFFCPSATPKWRGRPRTTLPLLLDQNPISSSYRVRLRTAEDLTKLRTFAQNRQKWRLLTRNVLSGSGDPTYADTTPCRGLATWSLARAQKNTALQWASSILPNWQPRPKQYLLFISLHQGRYTAESCFVYSTVVDRSCVETAASQVGPTRLETRE